MDFLAGDLVRYRLVPDQGGEDAAAAGEAPIYWRCMNYKAINTEVCDHEATITMLQGKSSSIGRTPMFGCALCFFE